MKIETAENLSAINFDYRMQNVYVKQIGIPAENFVLEEAVLVTYHHVVKQLGNSSRKKHLQNTHQRDLNLSNTHFASDDRFL